MARRFLAVVLAALPLAGCMTAEEQRAVDEAECRSYGFTPGTDAFANCLLQLDLDRRAAIRANRIALEAWDRPLVIYRPVPVYRHHRHH